MKSVIKSYKFRLYPTKEQKVLLSKHFGCVRFIYNYFLNREIETYKETKKFNFYNRNASILTQLKSDNDYSFLKEVNSQSLQWSLKFLNQGFLNKFKHGHCEFPKFKSRKAKQSFKVPVNSTFKIESNKIFIPKFKSGIKYKGKPNFKQPKFLNVTISKNNINEYYASIQYEDFVYSLPTSSNVVAFDLGIKDFIVTDKGIKIQYPMYYKQTLDKIKRLQRSLSLKTNGSNNYIKLNYKLSKLNKKVQRQRNDYMHKLSKDMINENQVIILEDLKNKQLMSINGSVMNQRLADSSFSIFINMILYKADWYQRTAIKVNPKNTSRTCHKCGSINTNLQLSQRTWVCENCNTTLDRDINAAKNILFKGLHTSVFKDFCSSERATAIKLATLDEVNTSEKEAIYL